MLHLFLHRSCLIYAQPRLTSKVLSSLFYCTLHCGTSAAPGWFVPQTEPWPWTDKSRLIQAVLKKQCRHLVKKVSRNHLKSLREVTAWTCWWDGGNDAHPPPVCEWAPNDVCAAISLSLSAAQLLVFAGKRRLMPSRWRKDAWAHR